MSDEARKAYVEATVLQADPITLIQILYRAAIESVAQARRNLRAGKIAARTEQVNRVSAILNELALSLDHERGGALSRNLVELYDYMQYRLLEANAQQTEAPLAEVERLLQTLLEGWMKCQPPAAPAKPALRLVEPEIASEPPPNYVPLSGTF